MRECLQRASIELLAYPESMTLRHRNSLVMRDAWYSERCLLVANLHFEGRQDI